MNKTNFQKVKEFMHIMGQDKDTGFNFTNLKKGLSLILEEKNEVYDAFCSLDPYLLKQEVTEEETQNRREEAIKELTDLIYVCYWTGVKLGIDLDKAFDLVHQSNLSKLDPETGKPIYREDGKVLKGANYKAPDMSILFKEKT